MPRRDGLLHFGAGLDVVSTGRKRPRIRIESEGIVAAGQFLAGDLQGLRRLAGVIHVVRDQFVIGVVGKARFAQGFFLELSEGPGSVVLAAGTDQSFCQRGKDLP